ncbi:hypothetical protein FHL15_006749 [Xylaria flabelliformis]|uniref:Choline monooxygenase, chloroplastic n=1 Tax=Xylaria flabelliformis TaxID=2512241 RepID=A0A553HWP6_9PEZI|nr:hypothetical protein FHL15_006749 [Xylaria flabelliformis]
MAELSIYYSPQVLFWTLSASLVAIVVSYISRISGLRWFTKGLSKTKNAGIKAVRALPGSWYLSKEMYELERRAIFSKKWLLTTHKIRLPNEGDWLRYQVAGFDFVIAKDRTGAINAFHNVCRHRAFPVVTKDEGNNSVLACKYHNWTYALNGKLTKAPSYQDVEGFDKSQNGLFPIHVHIDTNGFIWVNLESKDKPTTAWEDDYKGIDRQARFKAYDFDNYKFDHIWQMEGEYNWKLLGDNYNECYHCPTTHPDIPTVADLSAYAVRTENSYVQHLGNPTPEQIARGFNVAATFYFPNASMNVSPHFFFIQRFIPKSPNTSIMYYEVFRNKDSSDEDFQVINDIYKRIMSEDKYLCANAHKNIQAGVFVNGELHPRMEQGPLYFQKLCRDLVTSHHEQEKKAGQEIWPARQKLSGDSKDSEQDLDFCSSLDSSKSSGISSTNHLKTGYVEEEAVPAMEGGKCRQSLPLDQNWYPHHPDGLELEGKPYRRFRRDGRLNLVCPTLKPRHRCYLTFVTRSQDAANPPHDNKAARLSTSVPLRRPLTTWFSPAVGFLETSLGLMTPPGESTNLRGRRRSHHACLPCRPDYSKQKSRDQSHEGNAEDSEVSDSPAPACEQQGYPDRRLSTALSESENSDTRPGSADISCGLRLYFKYCHRQPIWCFEREDVNNYSSLSHELVCSILCLTARFSNNRDRLQLYGHNVRPLIMLRIANDGNINLGQFHVGLALQLCRSAMLDLESAYAMDDPTAERKKRLFWSLQLLEKFYGRQTGLPSVPTETGRSSYSSSGGGQRLLSELNSTMPALPTENHGSSKPHEPGIWNTGVHLGWVWSRVRKFVSDCAHNIIKEPWRHDSTYDSVKFYARTVEELRRNHDYWAPWLKEQFTYHAIPTVLNHPFLYIVGAQHNPNLAIPNTFWKRSSELALLHATWIVRMIDMIVDKQVQLVDPFLGHVAAIAATVHLYYSCAAAAGLKQKSKTDFAKYNMIRIAGGYQNMDMDEWIPSKLYLSVPLMWDILQFSCVTDHKDIPVVDLLHPSIAPRVPQEDLGENSTLEIDVATSPEIKVDTADGGQDAPSLSRRAHVKPDQAEVPRQAVWHEAPFEPSDNLTFNTTPWLYADPSQFVSLGDLGWLDSQSAMPDTEKDAPWWEGGNLSNVQFSQF